VKLFITLIIVLACSPWAWMLQGDQAGRLGSGQLMRAQASPWVLTVGGSDLYSEPNSHVVFGQMAHQRTSWGARAGFSEQRIDTMYQSVIWAIEGDLNYGKLFAWTRHEQRFHHLPGSASFWTPESRAALGIHASPALLLAIGVRQENHCQLLDLGIEWKIGHVAQMDFNLTRNTTFNPWEFTLGQRVSISRGTALDLGFGYPSRRISCGLFWSAKTLTFDVAQTYLAHLPPTSTGSCSWSIGESKP